MVSLDEWNEKIQKMNDWKNIPYPKENGIACPDCGEKLFDIDGIVLLSDPPKKRVICKKCSFAGYRLC